MGARASKVSLAAMDSAKAAALVASLRARFGSGCTKPRSWRDRQLDRLRALVADNERELMDALASDLGKSSAESWLAEIAMLDKEIAFTRKHLREWMKSERVPTPLALQPAVARIHREPLGVVLVIAPWNYPLQLALLPVVGALAAGNVAALKPSELAPATSAALARLVPRYFDADVLSVVEGGVPETTALLEQRWDHIFYTGNGTVGRVIMAAAAKHLTPVTLELGGKSPAIVHRSANLDVAARRIVWAKYFNAGQTCIAPDYVLVDRAVEHALLDKLAACVREFYGDDPSRSNDYARIVNERHFDRLAKLMDSGEVACGGQAARDQRYIAPTILRNVARDAPVMQQEIFGPILPVLAVDDTDDAVRFVADGDKPLALYVFAEDKNVQRRVLRGTSSGGACVNDAVAHFTVPGLPFGGVGESGMGAYHGRASFEAFSHRKSVLHKSSAMDVPLRYPPYDKRKLTWLKRLM